MFIRPVIVEQEAHIVADVGLSGWIRIDEAVYQGANPVYVGDSAIDKLIKAYLSFNIDVFKYLDDITITGVIVTISLDSTMPVFNHPELAGCEVVIKVFYYGATLDLADGATGV